MTTPFEDSFHETLHSHESFVRNLARSLLAEAQAAEDVVQGVWLAAARGQAPSQEGEPRAFLAGIVRNLVRKQQRGTMRRTQREERAARNEALPSTAELVVAEEWRRRIVDAVFALAEHERECVLLRFFEGLPPRAIATRLDVPVETVKTRLKRGLAHLKESLGCEDAEGGMLHGLGLVAIGPGLASKAGLLKHLGVESMIVTSKWKAAALVAGLVGVLGIGRVLSTTPRVNEAALAEVESEPALRERASTPAPAQESDAERTALAARADEAQHADVDRAALQGRLQIGDGEVALPGVLLELNFASAEPMEVITDALGFLQAEVDSPRRLVAVLVPSTERSAARRVVQDLQLTPESTAEVLIEVGRGATISGSVLDDVERPVAGAVVRAWCAASETTNLAREPDREVDVDASGRFSLHNLGEWTHLEARAPGYHSTASLEGSQLEGAHLAGVVLQLSPSAQQRVRVVDGHGAPVPNAEVSFHSQPLGSRGEPTPWEGLYRCSPLRGPVRGSTQADGTCLLVGLVSSKNWIRVQHPDHLALDSENTPGHEGEELVLTLSTGARPAGRVLDPGGQPVAGARLELHASMGRFASSSRSIDTTRSDSDGNFDFRTVGANSKPWLAVEAEGFAVYIDPTPFRGGDHLLVELEEQRLISGRVLNSTGEPMSDVSVEVVGGRLFRGAQRSRLDLPPTWEVLLGCAEARTDSEGRFELDSLYEGDFDLNVRWYDVVDRTQSFRVASGSNARDFVVDASLATDVSFDGRVTDALTGEPVERFTIIALGTGPGKPEFNSREFQFEDADGAFSLGGLPPMELSLYLNASGYKSHASDLQPRSAGHYRQDVQLLPVRNLTLDFRDQHGEGVAGTLTLRDSKNQSVWVTSARGAKSAALTVADDGLAALQDLPADELLLTYYPAARKQWPEGSKQSWIFPIDLRQALDEAQELLIEVPE